MLGPPSFGLAVATFFCSLGLAAADTPAIQLETLNRLLQDPCPAHCNVAGPVTSNWSVYHNFDQLQRCPQRLLLEFPIYDEIDDPALLHRFRTCTLWGADFDNAPPPVSSPAPATLVNVSYQVGFWDSDIPQAGNEASVFSVASAMRTYFSNGCGTTTGNSILFGLVEDTTFGIYLGKALQKEGMGTEAISAFASVVLDENISGSVAMQYCGEGIDADHSFGIIANLNGTFGLVQNAIRSWAKAECIGGLSRTTTVHGPIFVTAPPLLPILNGTAVNGSVLNGTFASRHISGKSWSNKRSTVHLSESSPLTSEQRSHEVERRSDCRTIQVAPGDSCAILAYKCGLPGSQITVFNPSPTFCSTLQPLQHICCSSGTLPNFAPQQNPDSSCSTYTTLSNDSCYSIAASHSLTPAKIENFNKNTWAWNGCNNLWVGVIMCLSPGTPPMPATVPNSVCGPQVPGTRKPPPGTDLSSLNPCPLNACCDVWGQCGTTVDFCTNTSTGAPGTAQLGTNGCISNCGGSLVRSGPPATFRNIAYFEGSNLGRPCLNMDVSQIDTSKYTHVHFAFATLNPDYSVATSDILSTFEFQQFVGLTGTKRILSFGGWDFSTNLNTYMIFRNGVTDANRLTMATNIANFIMANNLDGVDIDWEYPGAPDIPGIPAASTTDGFNYLYFLVTLKNLLPGKTVSVCAPSSYWYLKGFPIEWISAVVDYIVYMTYDLHGQWDYGNKWSDSGCPTGNCLRSHVNLTETMNSLVMITKAGVPSNKVIVGVTSYGRAFQMASPGCYGETCTFTGSASGAAPGPCTGVAGYISNAEIKAIAASDRVNFNYLDFVSDTNILVYDDVQWVSWMNEDIKSDRTTLYQQLNFGGTADWAVDLEDYQPAPTLSSDWPNFIKRIAAGDDPYIEGTRTGNWTSLTCTDPAVEGLLLFSPSERWAMLDCDNAWSDAVSVWQDIDYPKGHGQDTFGASISNTYHGFQMTSCSTLVDGNPCDSPLLCADTKGSGPGGYEVWNSLARIHRMYKSLYGALDGVFERLGTDLDDFENQFAPLPKDDNTSIQILLDIVGLGIMVVAAPFFDAFLATLPFFEAAAEGAFDTVKDVTYALISTSIMIAKDLTAGGTTAGSWTPEKQASFKAYAGETLAGWQSVVEQSVQALFNGSTESLNTLSSLISNGKMIDGNAEGGYAVNNTDARAAAAAAFYAYLIPKAWYFSGTNAFVVDSGFACGTVNPTVTYLQKKVQDATWVCYGPKMYYLVYPSGNAISPCNVKNCGGHPFYSSFSAPPGLDILTNGTFGGITKEILVTGSLRSYQANGNKNGGPVISPSSPQDLDDIINNSVTAAGYIRLPVCSAAEAFLNWQNIGNGNAASNPNYPCN